jgi:hypothetical protein
MSEAMIIFFKTTVIAGSVLGLGCLAAGLYFEYIRGKRMTRRKYDAFTQKESIGFSREK